MKGYTETRGQVCKLDFDVVTQQFVSRPIVHAFAPQVKPNLVVQKLIDWNNGREKKKRQMNLAKQLAAMSKELRDDIGLTEVFTSSQHS